jgi:hypothetical protein
MSLDAKSSYFMERFAACPRLTDAQAAELGRLLVSYAIERTKVRRGLSTPGVDGAPAWFGFEDDLWRLSEDVRSLLRKNKKLRGPVEPLLSIGHIVEQKQFGKGRQNFVLLLGEFGGNHFVKPLEVAAEDPDLVGHALNAATRTRVFSPVIAAVANKMATERGKGWIRTAAKQYLEKVVAASPQRL